MPTYLTNFVTRKSIRLCQEKVSEWLTDYHYEENREIFEKYAVKKELVNSRALYAPGILQEPEENVLLFQTESLENPSIRERGVYAQEEIEEIFEEFYRNETKQPDQLAHVSCTHYESPSGAQLAMLKKDWLQSKVTHLYHMGCYAALPAIRVAKSYNAEGSEHVDIVHTELCSFHLDRDKKTADELILQTLFADGAIKYSALNEKAFKKLGIVGLQILGHLELLVPNTDKEMTWKLNQNSFDMTLTKYVPMIIAKNIEKFMVALFNECRLDYYSEKENAIFAIHPGGPKIVELISRILKLRTDQVEASDYILRTRGNMSSATLPHIWDRVLNNMENLDKYIVTVAFGPGLTMTGAILKMTF